MLSNTSGINPLLTGNSSNALMGATSTGTASTDGDVGVSAFQEKLDKAMQKAAGMESTNEADTVEKEAGVSLSEDGSVRTEISPLGDAKTPNLSTREQNTKMSTLEKANFLVRTTKQKISDIKDALENGGGTEFLTKLKNLLLSLSNGDLDTLSIDEDGLEALADLLVQAGFDQVSVEELMSNLTFTLEEETDLISVSDLLADLSELPLAENEDITQAETLMPTSDLPYVKTLLSMMGVDEQQITSLMDQVSEGPRGFDFDDFIEQLEQLLETAGESGGTYQTQDENDAYKTLLTQLDLDFFIEDSDEPLTLATLIEAFTQKLDLIKNNLPDRTEQSVPEIFTTDPFEALATQSGRHGLLNQFLAGLNIEEDGEETVDSAITISANSDAMVKEIEGRIQVQFMDQVRGGGAGTKSAADTQTSDNKISANTKTKEVDFDDALKIADNFSDTTRTAKESATQSAVKAAQADTAALEKMTAAPNTLSGDTTPKNSETQPLIWGVEKSSTTSTMGTSATQQSGQAFSTLPEFVTRQVGKSIVQSINTGNDTIRMQLKPPELGRVYMSIDHNGSSMKVSVITEHQSAKDILTANINEIKTMLSSSGINLESFEVDMSSDFQQSMADARAQDQSARKKQAAGGTKADAQDDMSDNLTMQTATMHDSGSLHFVA